MTRDNDTASIFISYARSDGKDFAGQLRVRLEQEDLKVWQDLAALEGGKDWWRQIASVIQHKALEYLVLVMTPRALASPIVRKEWRLARQEGKCVLPVIGNRDLNFDAMPGWMKAAHFIDVDEPEQWTRMLRTLTGPCQQTYVPFMVEDLPLDFVPRPDEFEDLVGKLLERKGESTVAITAALRGAGGYGKTTLARALCHDERIQDTYHGGVLWVALGETPGDLTGHIEDLIYRLSNERPGFSSADAASNRLAELLADRSILLVVDDVWNAAHIRPFLRGRESCAHLITTRDAATLPADARRVPVDEMQASEAIALLESGLEVEDSRALAELARRLGEWPLLLKLVNAQLRECTRLGQTAKAAIDYVNRALNKYGLVAFDAKNPEDRHQAVASTLGVSMDVLDHAECERLTELAIFPEDAAVPLETVERLWNATANLDDLDTERLAKRLFELSLLQSLELTSRRLRMHDVVRNYLGQRLGEVALRDLHSQFLDAWGLDDWSALSPDEPYLWRHLVGHLMEAGRVSGQRTLLLDYRWLRAKLNVTDITALLADYTCATDDTAVRAVDGALRLSAHVLGKRKSELPSQLTGRLLNHAEPSVRKLCVQVREMDSEIWLRPLHPTLTPPGGPLLRTLEGHIYGVTAVALSADGRWAVSVAFLTLRVWDLGSGACLQMLKGHTEPVTAVAMSADGRRAVSGADDRTLRVWDLESGICLHTLEVHTDEAMDVAIGADDFMAVAMSADGRKAVSGPSYGTLKVWDLDSGACVPTFTRRTTVTDVAMSADGRRAVSGDSFETLLVWDLERGTCLHNLKGHRESITAVAMSADGRWAVSGAVDRTLRVWDLERGACLHTLEGHTDVVMAVAMSADGRRAVSGAADQTLRVWDLDSGACLQTLEDHRDSVSAVAMSADGRRAVSGAYDKTLRVWDLQRGDCLHTLDGHRDSVTAVALSADDCRAVSGAYDKTLRVWDIGSGVCLQILKGHRGSVTAVAMSADGRWAVSGAYDQTLRVWDLDSGACLQTLWGHRGLVTAVAMSADGRRAVSGADDRTLRVWERGACLQILGHRGLVTAVAMSADGRRAVSSSDDRTLQVWDLQRWACLHTLKGHTDVVMAVAMSADGRRAVSGAADQTLRVWDLDSGACLQTLKGHRDSVTTVALSTDGRRAVSGSSDQSLGIWDLDSGTCLLSFTGDNSVNTVAVTTDGSMIVAGDNSGRVHFLHLEGVI